MSQNLLGEELFFLSFYFLVWGFVGSIQTLNLRKMTEENNAR
jgi:hypothetical protein